MHAKKGLPGKLLRIGKKEIREYQRGRIYYVRWQCQFELKDGERVWRWVPSRTVHGKKADAESAVQDYRRELECLVGKKPSDIPFSRWVDMFQQKRIEDASREDSDLDMLTVEREGAFLRRIREHFGNMRFEDITPRYIVETFDRMREAGESAHTVYRVHCKLKQIFDYVIFETSQDDPSAAVFNICDLKLVKERAKQPKAKEKDALTQEEAATLARSILEEELTGYKVAVFLALTLGLRRGECLGLVWDDIDLESMVIHVRRQYGTQRKRKKLKTEQSYSDVAIDLGVVAFLRFWKRKQFAYFQSCEAEQLGQSPVCNNAKCGFAQPSLFNRWRRSYFAEKGLGEFTKIETYVDSEGHKRVRRSGYVGKNLHSLRHTQSTLLIGAGADLKTTQGRLRQATSAMTMDVYTHRIKENDRRAAALIEELLGLSNGRFLEESD